MARKPGAEAIYEIASHFRDRCLKSGHSLLWPELPAWTAGNMKRLWKAFMEHPDESEQSFYEKWKSQLADEPAEVHRIAADLVAFYYLFPYDIKKATKLERLNTVISWKLSSEKPDLASLDQAYDDWIGSVGPAYINNIPQQMAFFLAFAEAVRAGKADPDDVASSKPLADKVSKGIKTSKAGRNVLLHLLFPEKFESIASERYKRDIVETFSDLSPGTHDVDEALEKIRLTLGKGDPNFEFYQPDIRKLWDKESTPKTALDKARGQESSSAGPVCWIEKTIVRGRIDREDGEYAVGQALWCPKTSKGGADIYQFIRRLKAGDIILHLTDNTAFTRISRVSGPYEEFNGIPNTEWGAGPSYLVRLRDSIVLAPPLSRETFFASPYREQLISVVDHGAKNLFYNRELNLNQGAYLTPCPVDLVQTLNDAYKKSTGKSLADVVPEIEEIIGTGGAGNTWIFQANPAIYDIRGALRALTTQTWSVSRFKDEIKVGDKVYLWESGPGGGIVGVAEVTESPRMGKSFEEDRPFTKKPEEFAGEYLRGILKVLKTVQPP